MTKTIMRRQALVNDLYIRTEELSGHPVEVSEDPEALVRGLLQDCGSTDDAQDVFLVQAQQRAHVPAGASRLPDLTAQADYERQVSNHASSVRRLWKGNA